MLAARTAVALRPARTALDQGVTGEHPTWRRTLSSNNCAEQTAIVSEALLEWGEAKPCVSG